VQVNAERDGQGPGVMMMTMAVVAVVMHSILMG
jgi:hypothetical protein